MSADLAVLFIESDFDRPIAELVPPGTSYVCVYTLALSADVFGALIPLHPIDAVPDLDMLPHASELTMSSKLEGLDDAVIADVMQLADDIDAEPRVAYIPVGITNITRLKSVLGSVAPSKKTLKSNLSEPEKSTFDAFQIDLEEDSKAYSFTSAPTKPTAKPKKKPRKPKTRYYPKSRNHKPSPTPPTSPTSMPYQPQQTPTRQPRPYIPHVPPAPPPVYPAPPSPPQEPARNFLKNGALGSLFVAVGLFSSASIGFLTISIVASIAAFTAAASCAVLCLNVYRGQPASVTEPSALKIQTVSGPFAVLVLLPWMAQVTIGLAWLIAFAIVASIVIASVAIWASISKT